MRTVGQWSRRGRSYAITACVLVSSACSGEIEGAKPGDPNAPDPTAGAGATAGNAQAGTGGGAAGVSGGAGGSAGGSDCTTVDTGPSVLRRLSRDEYRLTLQQLLQLSEPPAIDSVPEDAQQDGFRTVAAIQSVSGQHLLAYLEVAEELGTALLSDDARRERVIGCAIDDSACLPAFVDRFGRLAFRRALTAEESSSLVSAATASAADTADRYRFAIEALLTAPSFLFRVEGGAMTDVADLAPTELASRLSFMLWGRGPSAELLDRAEAGELSTTAGIAAIAAEMLAAPEAKESTRGFFKQWLHFETLRAPNVAPEGFTEALLPDFIGETERVLDDFAWQPGARFFDVLTASYTYLSPALGEFYGLPVSGDGFTRVEIPATHARAGTGLLTHAAVISSKTDADLISHRGAFLRDALLCQKLTIPSNLQAEIQDSVAGLSYPEVIALRNSKQPCAGCHAMIDPVGVAFSQYDAIGHFDSTVDIGEYGLPTRFEGLDTPEFTTLAQLSSNLAAESDTAACLAEKLFIYTHGREPEPADACVLQAAREKFAETDGSLPSILAAFVESPAFRMRRSQ
jgi:hypothetical protein